MPNITDSEQRRHEQAAAEREAVVEAHAGAGVFCCRRFAGASVADAPQGCVVNDTGAAVAAVSPELALRPEGCPAAVLAKPVAGRVAGIHADQGRR